MLTPLSFTLLRQLSDGDFHSGEDLAAKVGLTRARVSQLLRQAETAGLSLERVRGLGYRLKTAPDFLDAAAVRLALAEFGAKLAKPGAPVPKPQVPVEEDLALNGHDRQTFDHTPPALQVEVADQLDSTSTELLRRAPRRDIHGAVLAAEWQTAGRGRRGRHWASPVGNLYTSAIVRPDCPAARAAELGFVAALAVADMVPAGRPVRLKWPNDVLVEGAKVAGILPESSIGADGQAEHVILGIGVNVGFAPELPEMRYPGACLGGTVEIALETLAAALAQRLARWRRDGFEPVRAEWLAKAGPLGLEVDVKLGEELVQGRFAGMDREGALLLDTAAGPRRIVAGELLARAA